MHIVIAPNAFKGSISAEEAAQFIADGLRQSRLVCDLHCFPVADGGDGTASLLVKKMKGEIIRTPAHDPLGRRMRASFGWIAGEKQAIIGLADASGLKLLKEDEQQPLHADTFGTGELIKAALERGAEKMLIGVGGSATVDGGSGLLRALGVRLLDTAGQEIKDLPAGLAGLHTIDTTAMDKRLMSTGITVLCDVKNTLLGGQGAAHVFGPQKGADKEDIGVLEKGLTRWTERTKEVTGIDMAALPYGGAAGGVAAALAAFAQAKLVSGIEFFLDELHIDDVLVNTDVLITAEGSIDEQTLEGKGPFGVARRAKARHIPVIGMAGQVPEKISPEMHHYFDRLIAINPPETTLEEAIRHTGTHLTIAALALGNQLAGTE